MNSQLRPTLGKSNQILFVDVIVVKNLRKVQHSLIFGWNYHGHISRHWKFELGPQILPVLISAIDIQQFIYVTTPLLSLRVLQNVSSWLIYYSFNTIYLTLFQNIPLFLYYKWQLFFKCYFSSQLPVYAQKKPHHIRGSPFLFTHSRSLSCSVILPFSLHSFGCSLNVIHSVNTNICIYAVGGFFCYRRQYY